MSKIIEVVLNTIDDMEQLEFLFEKKLTIDLKSDNQDQLKIFFNDLLKNLLNDRDIRLKYKSTERKDLFSEVAEKYVNNLDKEIQALIPNIPKI